MTNINVIQARPFQLAEPIGTSDTEITVKNLFDIYGNPIVMSGDIQYSTVEPQSQTNQEIISYTGIVQLTTTTSKLTGVTRGLDAQPDPVTGLYGSSPSQAKAHSANAECILSDNPQVWDKKTSKDEEETVTEEWTFDVSPQVPTPTGTGDAVNKDYADTLAVLGSPDASTTQKGISRLTASPNVTLGTVTITIATPGVFTKATHGLTVNDTVQFTTTGALPTGLTPSVTYYVIATGLTANDFQVSATYGGGAVATSGSQSGVHTAVKTTPKAVGENDTRLPTQAENDAIVGTSGTAVSSSNKLVDNADTSATPSASKVVRYGADASLGATQTVDTTYPAGETLTAGNVVFIENAPTTAQATSAQNIGDVTANTRISFPAFGSGTSASTLKLNLAKNGSPSVNLGVRIETDNAGSPSGTLVNANATGTVTAASLGTGAFLGNNTTTVSTNITDSINTTTPGYRFLTNGKLRSITVTLDPYCTATRLVLQSDAGATLTTASFSGGVATITYTLTAGTYYKVVADNNGSNFLTSQMSGSYPYNGTNLNIVSDSTGSTSTIYNMLSIYSESYNETDVTLAGAFTIPAGQKCHIVTYQGTYGSETVNASNFYSVGYYTNDTTTRLGMYWSGSAWSAGSGLPVTEDSTRAGTNSTADTNKAGLKILTKSAGYIKKVTKTSTCTATTAYIQNTSGVTLATATFSGNVATFNYYFTNATSYWIVCDSGGSSYTRDYSSSSPTYPVVQTRVNFTARVYNGAESAGVVDNLQSIETASVSAASFSYTSSSLFQPRVLSKTDQRDSGKLSWFGITQEAVTAGDLTTGKYPKIAISGVDSNQTGLIEKIDGTIYLGNSGALQIGGSFTNVVKIGRGISDSKIHIIPRPL